jgi:uncharacterized membrane protein YedE/YeeE
MPLWLLIPVCISVGMIVGVIGQRLKVPAWIAMFIAGTAAMVVSYYIHS